MSQNEPGTDWPAYYARTRGRAPRSLFVEALARLPDALTSRPEHFAIDLGSGDGTESLALLERGWHVLALDGEPTALALLEAAAPAEQRARLQTHLARFETLALPTADFVYAGLSLPFCPPAAFAAMWDTVTGALSPGSWLAAHFFGIRDGWAGTPTMTFLTAATCRGLLAGLEVEEFRELEHEGMTVGGPHQIHAFEVIAHRPSAL